VLYIDRDLLFLLEFSLENLVIDLFIFRAQGSQRREISLTLFILLHFFISDHLLEVFNFPLLDFSLLFNFKETE
jgi:hypothetical protein